MFHQTLERGLVVGVCRFELLAVEFLCTPDLGEGVCLCSERLVSYFFRSRYSRACPSDPRFGFVGDVEDYQAGDNPNEENEGESYARVGGCSVHWLLLGARIVLLPAKPLLGCRGGNAHRAIQASAPRGMIRTMHSSKQLLEVPPLTRVE